MTFWTAVLLGVIYPLLVTARRPSALSRKGAQGQLLRRNGALIGSRIIGPAVHKSWLLPPQGPSAAGVVGYAMALVLGDRTSVRPIASWFER